MNSVFGTKLQYLASESGKLPCMAGQYMRIESDPQATALREFLAVLELCSDGSCLRMGGCLEANIQAWWAERNVRLLAAQNALLRAGYDVPDDWLQIRVPTYWVVHDKYCDKVDVAFDPRIWPAIEQIRLNLMRFDAVHPSGAEVRDPRMEARDQWIYEECCKHTVYKAIIAELEKRTDWDFIGSPQGIKVAANSYALRHGKPPIPKRTRGRRPKSN